MASDIVERLNSLSEEYRDHDPDVVLFAAEGAAELTRLRAELAEAQKATADSIGEEWRAMERRAEAAERDRDAAKAEAERMREALRRVLNHIENTESAFGMKLACGNIARAALQEKP